MVFTHEEQSSRIFEVETVKELCDPDATPLKRLALPTSFQRLLYVF